MTDNEQELLSEDNQEVKDAVELLIEEGHRYHITLIYLRGAKAQVAKLKAMGYEQVWTKCPDCNGTTWVKPKNSRGLRRETCPTCKGTGKITNRDSILSQCALDHHGICLEDSGYVKWDREKVAKVHRCYRNCRLYPSLCKTFKICETPIDEGDYLQADQLHKILTKEVG